MKRLIFFIFIFMSVCCFASQTYVLVKYSTSDCVFCNMQLNSLGNLDAQCPAYIVLRKNNEPDSELAGQLKDILKSRAKILYSDSIYYKFDSSERSYFYLISDGKILYKQYLKSASNDTVTSIFHSLSDVHDGNIVYPNLTLIRQSSNSIYIGGNSSYILQVNKANLNKVADTLFVNSNNLKKELFKVTYGEGYKAKYDSFSSWSKQYRIPNVFQVNDFQPVGDSLFVMVTMNTIDIVNDNLFVRNNGYILIYHRKKCIMQLYLDSYKDFNSDGGVYNLTNSFFYFHNNCFYVSVGKNDLTQSNALYAKCTVDGRALKIRNIVRYDLPVSFVKNKVGYMLAAGVGHDGILSNLYSDEFYVIRDEKTISLSADHLQNLFSNKDVSDLKFKINYMVLNFSWAKDDLSVLYQSGDSLINAHYDCGNNFKQRSRKIISTPFPDKEWFVGYGIICDEKGIYSYNSVYRRFDFYPY